MTRNGVEQCAERATSLISRLVDELKAIPGPEFRGSTEINRLEDPHEIESILLPRLGSELESLIHDVELSVPTDLACWHIRPCIVEDHSWNESGWAKVIHEICIPLLNILGRCYACLDEREVASPELAATAAKGKHRPTAPPGMLSIQGYVDIGVLLEVTVILSILPFLDNCILPSIEHRIRAIPRTIIGRTPLKALRIGYASLMSSSNLQQCRLFALSIGISSIGNTIHLDRFRPMFFPRHLADLYAGVLQSQQLFKRVQKENVQNALWGFPFAGLQRVSKLLQPEKKTSTMATHQARAFQTLLLHGKDCPPWLKERLSISLDDLATSRLDAIVEVFVLEATKDRTSSSARLAKTLLAKHKRPRSKQYYGLIGGQLLLILDNVVRFNDQVGKNKELVVHFLWLMIDLLDDEYILSVFFEHFAAPFRNPKAQSDLESIHQMVLQVKALLSLAPATVDRWRFCQLVLFRRFDVSHDTSTSMNDLFSLIVRLAASDTFLKKTVKEDSLQVLRNVFIFIAGDAPSRKIGSLNVLDVSVVAATQSLARCLSGNKIAFNIDSVDDTGIFDKVSMECHELTTLSLDNIADSFQTISELFFLEVVLPCYQMKEIDAENGTGKNLVDLPSRMLEYFLYLCLKDELNHNSRRPGAGRMRLAALIMIPVLCESCPMEAFLPNPTGNFRMLRLMKLVFGLLSTPGENSDCLPREVSILSSFEEMEELLQQSLVHFEAEDLDFESPQGLGYSLAAVLLNLLSCLLELGAPRRHEEFEDDLQALTSSLMALAEPGFSVSSVDPIETAEITDAASHLLTLIAVRRASGQTLEEARGPAMTIHAILDGAEKDLNSPDPPIRARGVASLRQLVASDENFLQKGSGITILPTDTVDGYSADQNDMDRMLALLLKALADAESFVFLASIHTLARIASFTWLFRRLVVAIMRGVVNFNRCDYSLSNDQRVKLTEVVITVLRRSPEARHNASMVLELLLYEQQHSSDGPKDDVVISKIQQESLSFFENFDKDDDLDAAGRWKEKSIKLRTGGPLFLVEEDSLVRASLLNMATNVVSLIQPSTVAKFSSGLIDCCKTLLLLQSSERPILRGAASLSVSLYSCVITEAEELLESQITTARCPMAISMAKGREEDLFHVLSQIVEDSESDFGVKARAEEALKLRQRAEEGGMLALGHLALEKSSRQEIEIVANLLSRS